MIWSPVGLVNDYAFSLLWLLQPSRFSETPVNIYQSTLHNITEELYLLNISRLAKCGIIHWLLIFYHNYLYHKNNNNNFKIKSVPKIPDLSLNPLRFPNTPIIIDKLDWMYSSYCMSKYQAYGLVGYDSLWWGTNILEELSTFFSIVNKKKAEDFSEFFSCFLRHMSRCYKSYCCSAVCIFIILYFKENYIIKLCIVSTIC